MWKGILFAVMVASLCALLATCKELSQKEEETETITYSVTYDGNGSTGGTVPTDSKGYETGEAVTVLGNTGNLVKAGYTLMGWDTQAGGTGTFYVPGASFVMASSNVKLYAIWEVTASLDTTFDPGTGVSGGTVFAVAVQNDGKILIGGTFNNYNGTTRNRLARINSDGSLDTGFDPGAGANSDINSIALQSDGKIVISGSFTSYDGNGSKFIARVNADGSFDSSFLSNPITGLYVQCVAVQNDGKILAGGSFTNFAGAAANNLVRINADGSHDTSFDTSTGAGATVYAIAFREDGLVLIGGSFNTYGGSTRNRIAGVDKTDGSLDASFAPSTGTNDTVQALAVRSDDRVYLGGIFTTFNGTGAYRLARANTDGTIDTAFDTATGASLTIYGIAVQADGKVVIGGRFTSYGGSSRRYLARVNVDGSVDSAFDTSTGMNTNGYVYALALQGDGKIIAVGDFTDYKGTGRSHIARIIP